MAKTNEIDMDVLELLKARMSPDNTLYMWVAYCADGDFTESSEKGFSTKEEAYNDMRNHALEKMKWNTDYKEDFESDEDTIGYNVTFKKDKIEHNSYSGRYIYKVVPYDIDRNIHFDVFCHFKGRSQQEINVIERIVRKKLMDYADVLISEFNSNIEDITIGRS